MSKFRLNTESKAWIAYDAGNSAFATTVVAAFFPIFYKEFWSTGVDNLTAASYYSWTLTFSNLALLFSAPIIGSITDLSRTTKKLFTFFVLISIVFVALLSVLDLGDWFTALLFFGIANYCFSAGNILYDKMLVQIAPQSQLTRISSLGFAYGYLGGGVLFLINAFMTLSPETFGLADASEAIQWSFVMVSVWWGMFLIPLLIHYKDRGVALYKKSLVKESTIKVFVTLRNISEHKNAFLFLLAFFLYIDGVHTVMALASTFALNLGLASSSVIVGLILVQFVAFPATLIWSRISSRYGDRSVINICIVAYIGIIFYSTTLSSATEFYILAAGVGSVQGGIQACSRSLFGKLVPEEKSGEFFGFFNTFGKAGAFIGPALVAIFITVFDSITIALTPIILLFITGGMIMLKVKEPNETIK
ncbi:MFS transporter [Gammaproteobacteria bacterium]|jgi:MFS transporter, UMF1 family|nr:MFS transporter [Gammaproteobacteria bacterium]MDC1190749.1 MFS transporter [Gammaproteobacteria bacterium]